MEVTYSFPSTDAAYNCMQAIDKIADWNVARQYGSYSYYVSIVTEYLAKESEEVQREIMALISMYGGKLN